MKDRLIPTILTVSVAFGGALTPQRTFAAEENSSPSPSIASSEDPSPTLMQETSAPESEDLGKLKETIENFTWDDFDNDEKLNEFKNQLAQGYVLLTGTENFTPEELTQSSLFFRDFEGFEQKANELNLREDFKVIESQLATTVANNNTDGKSISLFNLSAIGDELNREVESAGYYVMDLLWNVWGTNDATPNTSNGLAIGSPFLFYDPYTETSAVWGTIGGYYGGQIFFNDAPSYLDGFHHTLNKARIVRLAEDKMNISLLEIFDGYNFEPVEEIVEYTENAGISSQELNRLYTESDLEEVLEIIGSQQDDEIDDDLSSGINYALVVDDYFNAIYGGSEVSAEGESNTNVVIT